MQAHGKNELRFFGKVTAACTHEMKNVLAVIKEYSGLMEDLMTMAKETPMPQRDKFQKAITAITKQVQRGAELTDRLNRFAHSPDAEIARINLHETIQQLLGLSDRFARVKAVMLQTEPPEAPQALIVYTRPIQLLMTLFACLEICLDAIPTGSRITVRPQAKGKAFLVQFICTGQFSGSADMFKDIPRSQRWAELERMASFLNGSVQIDAAACGIQLSLSEIQE